MTGSPPPVRHDLNTGYERLWPPGKVLNLRDSSAGWRELIEAKPLTPIRELVAGLDDVATQPIPYGQLPRRAHNAYAQDFTQWSDIAGQTPNALLCRPKVGVSTVAALLAAAEDAVAAYRAAATASPVAAGTAVQRLLDRLDERDLAMLSARVWAARPQSQRILSERLNINLAWIQRNERWAKARFAELLADPAHRQVSEYAAELRQQLGPFVPESVVAAELRRIDVDPESQVAQVLLYHAGPYIQCHDWFEDTSVSGKRKAAAAVHALLDCCPAPSTTSLIDALTALGMTHDVAATYLDTQTGLRRIGDNWVTWGDSAADKAQAVLHARRTPATPDEIHSAMGIDNTTTLRAVREALYADDRFIRNSRQTWGLRTWGGEEYSGIFEEIAARIDAAPGGVMNVDELTYDLLSKFPDVAEGSVRAFLNTLAFIVDGRVVRQRTGSDDWPSIPPLNKARGAFRNGDNEIRLAVEITSEVLRGSGQPIHPAVAAALGVNPGQRKMFSSAYGQVPVTWRLSSTNGPSIGSLRAHARASAAALADTLVLVFSPHDQRFEVVQISAGVAGVERLRRLLGRSVRTPVAALASSLDCRRGDVAAVLRDRGDDDLADLADLADFVDAE